MELKLTANNATEKKVLAYLQENASEALAEKINAGSKTIAGAMKYAKEEARKIAHGENSVAVEDETVFGWIIHYFEESEIKEATKKPSVKLPSGVKMREPAAAAPAKKATKPQVVEVKDQKSLFADFLK